jgi:hypothetical protein
MIFCVSGCSLPPKKRIGMNKNSSTPVTNDLFCGVLHIHD